MPKTSYNIKDRICVNDFTGTVRYKGPIEGTRGEYYGIEWDVASRGKHNGTHAGKTYFETSDGETSGSFVREKLMHPAVTCIEAINDKYGKVDDELAGVIEDQAYLTQGDGGFIKVEVVGMKSINDLQSRFDELRIVDLTGMLVYGETNTEALGRLIPLTEELNLSENMISTWTDVGEIIKHLNNLRFLHLRGNRLLYSTDVTDEMKVAFGRIKVLNMASMNLTWAQILESSPLWPQVDKLHICKNRITEITTSPRWDNLTLLNLDMNSLKSWSNVKPFAKLPCLQELLLNQCELEDIQVDEGDFPSLETLSLRDNNIKEWKHVGELNKISSLKELVFMNSPVLLESDVETNRQLTIARILSINRHNRTKIDQIERRGAEIDYSKRYGEAWIVSGASMERTEQNAAFCAEHPTYLDIVNKWGAPEKTEILNSKKTSALKKSLIEVTFVDLVTESGKTVTKYIPDTMSVVKARQLALKLLKIRGIQCVISYRAHQNDQEYEFEYDLRAMTYYGVQHGDEILLRQVP